MVPLHALWLPILLSSVLVFLVSALIHTALGYHNNDLKKLPDQDAVGDALRKLTIPPGTYFYPRADTPKEMRTPEFREKYAKGPVVLMTVLKNAQPGMGKSLLLWFVYCLIVGVFAAYATGRASNWGAEYLHVFRFAGFTAFVCYAVGNWQDSIWYGRSWTTTAKNTLDALVYGLLTAGVFGWLWPH